MARFSIVWIFIFVTSFIPPPIIATMYPPLTTTTTTTTTKPTTTTTKPTTTTITTTTTTTTTTATTTGNVSLVDRFGLNINEKAEWVQRFYSFAGNNAMSLLQGAYNQKQHVTNIETNIPYCKNENVEKIYVSTNGFIQFNTPISFAPAIFGDRFIHGAPIIAPFAGIFKVNALRSYLFYEKYNITSTPIVQRATADIQRVLNDSATRFSATEIHLFTWYKVLAWPSLTRENTFQAALITNGGKTFARFAYGKTNLETSYVQVGYTFGQCEGVLSGVHSPNGLENITGNYGDKGVWFFELTKNESATMQATATTIITTTMMLLFFHLIKVIDA